MKIALFNERITIQKAVVTVDGIGNRKNSWEDYYSCFATISGENGTEREVAGTTVEQSDIAFTVRWCSTVSEISSTGYRIMFHGEIYNILLIDHKNFKKKSLKFKCQKVRR